ncbi:hypothetical protein HYALB_00001657 [Hymenoscyphus albidus]|uniref:JmjC domain-containing protein n=1 Tax=Hymenoscyphus albidus TaxID=595503 RepID=A0A9N9LBM8_9HELO|nr:hypothetical protein HYALB_00001657 [Hymenoscyphus albidus]
MSRPLIRTLTTTTRRSNSSLHNVSQSHSSVLPPIEKLLWRHGEDTMIEEFRRRAFIPETPVLITSEDPARGVWDGVVGAGRKWFVSESGGESKVVLEYLGRFGETILPYELVLPENLDGDVKWGKDVEEENISKILALVAQRKPQTQHESPLLNEAISTLYSQTTPSQTFHRFHAPLSLLLYASILTSTSTSTSQSSIPQPTLQNLYIAQAQLLDLPPELRADLPLPSLVLHAGKGDLYDANLWLGIPPTYTPLHADPNPNLFVQLAGRKRVRLFPKEVGRGMLGLARGNGGFGGIGIRGEEMMEGKERRVLDGLVWGGDESGKGREVVVREGEGLFVPRGWWHCVVSVGEGVNGSVNWWFR